MSKELPRKYGDYAAIPAPPPIVESSPLVAIEDAKTINGKPIYDPLGEAFENFHRALVERRDPAEKEIGGRLLTEILLKADRVALAIEALCEGKIRLLTGSWDDARTILVGQELVVRWVDGQVQLLREERVIEGIVTKPRRRRRRKRAAATGQRRPELVTLDRGSTDPAHAHIELQTTWFSTTGTSSSVTLPAGVPPTPVGSCFPLCSSLRTSLPARREDAATRYSEADAPLGRYHTRPVIGSLSAFRERRCASQVASSRLVN
jgi:hypothetical protein